MKFVLLLFLPAAAWAQSPPAFDVVSVKAPDPAQTLQSGPAARQRVFQSMREFQYTPGRVSCNMPLRFIVAEAFHGTPWKFSSEGWLDEWELFQIDATMPGDIDRVQARLMLRTMLAERFGLQFHLVMRNANVYALEVGKSGPKLKPAAPNAGASPFSIERGEYHAPSISLSGFAAFVARAADLPVVDKTGISGKYQIDLKWKINEIDGGTLPDNGILRAVTKLGLQLKKRSLPFETVIIDHMEPIPTQN